MYGMSGRLTAVVALACGLVLLLAWPAGRSGVLQGAGQAQPDSAAVAANIPTVELNSGYSMPLVGLGTSGLSGDHCTSAVASALELGFRHIDTAQMYGNEALVGKAIGKALAKGLPREDLFIVTKLNNNKHEPGVIEEAVRESLANLQLLYIDLFHIHWPMSPEIEPETWAAMEALVDKGLVRSIGVSNFSPEKIDGWLASARIQPAVNQVEVHGNWRNDRLITALQAKGIHVTAYAPLSSPATMDSQGRKVPNLMTDDETVQRVAKKLGKSPAQVLLAWGLRHGTSVIPRSGKLEHQQEIIATPGIHLSDEDYTALGNNTFQLKYFDGQGMAFGPGAPYSSYQDLWDEAPPPSN